MNNLLKNIKIRLTDLSKRNLFVRNILRTAILILRKIVYLKYYLFNKVDNKTIIFEAYLGKSYACSPKALYQQLINNPKYQDYNLVWAFNDPDKYKEDEELNRATLISYHSKEYKNYYSKAKYWISNSRIPEYIIKKPNQIYVQCWHGTPLKKLGYDIIPESQNALNTKEDMINKYKRDAKRYNYLLSPSKFASQKFNSAFGLEKINKQDTILEMGYPRNDYLFKYTKKEQNKIISSLNLPKDKKVILYAPTWRDNQHKSGLGYTYKIETDFDKLQRELADEYIILFRAHYFISNSFNFKKYENFIFDVSEVDDINDLYIISDILITDYSSVFFDFANLKRPIIFYMYDLEYYENLLRGFYIDLKELPGPIVQTEQEIIDKINNINIYQHQYENKYLKFNQKYNYLDSADVSEKVLTKIIN